MRTKHSPGMSLFKTYHSKSLYIIVKKTCKKRLTALINTANRYNQASPDMVVKISNSYPIQRDWCSFVCLWFWGEMDKRHRSRAERRTREKKVVDERTTGKKKVKLNRQTHRERERGTARWRK